MFEAVEVGFTGSSWKLIKSERDVSGKGTSIQAKGGVVLKLCVGLEFKSSECHEHFFEAFEAVPGICVPEF